jgi:hypothetical protein
MIGEGRRMHRVRVTIASALVALAGAAGAAAHGDPTSHTLETDNLVTTYASPPAIPVELRLRGLLDASAQRGYPIKVSLIASTYDTGGEAEPLASPQRYAELVSHELELVEPMRAPVLIVTPGRIAVSGKQLRDGRLRPVGRADALELVRGIELPRKVDGNALARAAMLAVRRVASAGGRPLPTYVPPAEQNLTRIATPVPASDDGIGRLGIAFIAGSALLLGSLLYAVSRRAARQQSA